jgi:acyl dehydratase
VALERSANAARRLPETMAEQALLHVDVALLSRPAELCEFEVTADAIAAYSEAINDDSGLRAGPAPALFAVVPPSVAVDNALTSVVPPGAWLSSVHGDHDVQIHCPIEAGMLVRSSVVLHGVHARRSGTQVILRSRSEANGSLLNDQYWTLFVRNHFAERDLGEPAPDHALPDAIRGLSPSGTATQTIRADQCYRYARASGDNTAYHVDESAARAAGFPSVILHGLCTLGLAVRSLRQAVGLDDDRIVRLAGRFVRPVLPDSTIATSFWHIHAQAPPHAFAFEVADDHANIVITNGRVEVS